jgi:hypothetical protein
MNRFGLIACVFLLSGLLVGCNGCHQDTPPSDVKPTWSSEKPVEKAIDASQDIRHEAPVKEEAVKKSNSRSKSGAASYSSSSRNDDYDNMRGFDPASEDDMDDNGMSRYMENNDDEGWD